MIIHSIILLDSTMETKHQQYYLYLTFHFIIIWHTDWRNLQPCSTCYQIAFDGVWSRPFPVTAHTFWTTGKTYFSDKFVTVYKSFEQNKHMKCITSVWNVGKQLQKYMSVYMNEYNKCKHKCERVVNKLIFWIFVSFLIDKKDCMNVCSVCSENKVSPIMKTIIFLEIDS